MFWFISMYLIIGVVHTITFVSLLIDDGEDLFEDDVLVWVTKFFLVIICWPITLFVMFLCSIFAIKDSLDMKKAYKSTNPAEFE
jgi:hypothetical protein